MKGLPLPKVSLVIPFLNSARYLREAVESVLLQTVRDWELLLVDGGSRDGSRKIALDFAARRPGQIRVLGRRSKPLGIFASRVLAAKNALAPLIALLDSDDAWDPTLLRERLAGYRRAFGARPGVVFGPSVHWRLGNSSRRLELQPVPKPGLYLPPALLPQFLEQGYIKTPTTSGTLLARTILLECAHLSRLAGRHMLEDQYLWSFAALRHPILVQPRPLVWYRRRTDSICGQGMARGDLDRLRRRHLAWLAAFAGGRA